jgi:predicted transcriptional regulator
MKRPASVRVYGNVSPGLKRALEAIAKANRRSLANLIGLALTDFVNDYSKRKGSNA